MTRQRIVWHLEVPQHLNELLESYIERDAYKTKSEFIRVAVRDRLEREFEKLRRKEENEPEAEQIARDACTHRPEAGHRAERLRRGGGGGKPLRHVHARVEG